jgi:hypothetical protein
VKAAIRIVLIGVVAFWVSLTSLRAQGKDSTSSSGKTDTIATALQQIIHEDLHFPSQSERLVLLTIAIITVGGLGIILNEKRRRADKNAGISSLSQNQIIYIM